MKFVLSKRGYKISGLILIKFSWIRQMHPIYFAHSLMCSLPLTSDIKSIGRALSPGFGE